MRAILLAALCLGACGTRQDLPTYGFVPHFTLTDQNGAEFDSRTLDGRVWIADFIYTNCPGPCPRMSTAMSKLQDHLAGRADVRLVSFTVDPDRDTPEVLLAYGKRYHADPERWHLLTGPKPTLQKLSRNAFQLEDITATLDHSTRFALVDRKGNIRGYYSATQPNFLDDLLRDVSRLP